jgi:SAM-dependent methyltransferase
MTRIDSKDYHDYFIKEGRFIGEFEQMYANVEDPWHIDSLGARLDMVNAISLMKHFGPRFERVLDVGCGTGLFTALVSDAAGGKVSASDVSETAVSKARERYAAKNIEFFQFDLKKAAELPFPPGTFDLIVMAQVVWCILPELHDVLRALRSRLKPDGALLISQHFLQPGQQKYGNEILETPEQLLAILRGVGFDVAMTVETSRFTNHHVAIFAKANAAASGSKAP